MAAPSRMPRSGRASVDPSGAMNPCMVVSGSRPTIVVAYRASPCDDRTLRVELRLRGRHAVDQERRAQLRGRHRGCEEDRGILPLDESELRSSSTWTVSIIPHETRMSMVARAIPRMVDIVLRGLRPSPRSDTSQRVGSRRTGGTQAFDQAHRAVAGRQLTAHRLRR